MNSNPIKEREIVILLTKGDNTAFEELYNLYSKRLLGYLIRFVKSEVLATDLFQDIFLKIWNNRENIDPDKSFRSYLFKIAESLVYDFFRKAACDRKIQDIIINKSVNQYRYVEDTLNKKENMNILREAINNLPPKRKQIFELVKIEGHSYDEVSKSLNISVSTINDHVVKATKSIRKFFEYHNIVEVSSLWGLIYFWGVINV